MTKHLKCIIIVHIIHVLYSKSSEVVWYFPSPLALQVDHRVSELNLSESFMQWTRSIDSLNRPKRTICLQFRHCFFSQGALDRISVFSENDLNLVLLLIRSRGFRKLAVWVIWTSFMSHLHYFMVRFSYFRAWQHSSPFTFIKWKNLQEYSSKIILLCSTEERKSNLFEKRVTNDRSFINGRTIPLYILSATFFNQCSF